MKIQGQDIYAIFVTSSVDVRESCIRATFNIRQNDSSLVVLLYNDASQEDKSACLAYESCLRELLSGAFPKPQITVSTIDDFSAIVAEAKKHNTTFSLRTIGHTGPSSPSLRLIMDSGESVSDDSRFFEDFDDMPQIKNRLNQVMSILARSDEFGMTPCVLLTGETGCGKSYTAKLIYKALVESKSISGKFIPINCASLPREHIDSFIFGVPKGVFTDVGERDGAIADAENGVLFLDEIGELPLDSQSHLLTLLDEGTYSRYGEPGKERTATCKFIFGTNANLPRRIAQGSFRRDLYNRISAFPIDFPNVKTRISRHDGGEDFFTRTTAAFCKSHGGLVLTDNARKRLLAFAHDFPWNGNFRDVKHLFENLALATVCRSGSPIVSSRTMSDVIETFTADNESINSLAAPAEDYENASSDATPPIEVKDGLAAYELVTLEYLRKVAATSVSSADAGRKFFSGKDISNPCDSFRKILKKFSLKWDKDTPGHLKSIK